LGDHAERLVENQPQERGEGREIKRGRSQIESKYKLGGKGGEAGPMYWERFIKKKTERRKKKRKRESSQTCVRKPSKKSGTFDPDIQGIASRDGRGTVA